MVIKPCLRAKTTASVRALAFSFLRIEVTWFLIVCSLMPNSTAICLFKYPCPIYFSICISRGVNGDRNCSASLRLESSWNCSKTCSANLGRVVKALVDGMLAVRDSAYGLHQLFGSGFFVEIRSCLSFQNLK